MSERRADFLAVTLLAALLTLLFADVLIGVNSFYDRDLAYYYHPAKHVLREIVRGGEFPSWNPYFSAGQPLAANPEHEVFYPPTWLILLPDYDFGFHLLIVLHLYLAAGAMYALLRAWVRPPAAFFGALSFALGGICLSYLNLLPCLFAIAWLPLTCLFTRRFLRERRLRDFGFASLSLGMQLLVGEPSTILQTGILLGVYAMWRELQPAQERTAARSALRSIALVALIILAASCLAAVQLLPAIDHAAQSVRGRGFAFETVTSWSLPPARLVELLHPNLLGHYMLDGKRVFWGAALYPGRGLPFLHSIYSGLLVTVLLFAGLFSRVRGRGLVLLTIVVSTLLAFGAHTPLWRWLYDLGIARSIRYPEKFLVMAMFVAIVFAAIVLQRLLDGDARVRRMTMLVSATVVALTGLAALIALTPLHARAFIAAWEPPARVLEAMLPVSRSGWLLAAGRALLLLILLRNLGRVRRGLALGLLGVFVLLDLGMLVPELAPRVPRRYFTEAPRLAQEMPREREEWRLFHAASWMAASAGSYVAPQPDLEWIHRNAMYPPMPSRWGIRTAIDIDFDRTALLPTVDFTDAVWELSRRRPDWLQTVAVMANVRYCAVYVDEREAYAKANEDRTILQPVRVFPLEPNPRYFFAEHVERVRDTRDFLRKVASGAYPQNTAFVQAPSFTPARGVVTRAQETSNSARIEVETAGRAFLNISITPQKYWRVTIDGNDVQPVITNIGFQGVVIPNAGKHVVEMHYRNPLFGTGGALSAAAALALIACVILRAARHAPAREESHRRPARV